MLYKTDNPHGGDIYGEGENKIVLDYSANTNPLGTPPGVIAAMQEVLGEVHHYPDPYCRRLVRAIAEYHGVPSEYVLCGNGAAELIYAYCEALCPKKAVELAPTFLEYSLGLERVGCEISRYYLRQEDDFGINNAADDGLLGFLRQERPDVLFLCNPNNPTGRLIGRSLLIEILRFCREYECRLFLDECFLDLCFDEATGEGEAASMVEFLADYPELFILKAFTKSYGMAGVRLGYCLSADSELLAAMSRAVQPWNVSVLAQAAGVAALSEGEFLRAAGEVIRQEREFLRRGLVKLGFRVCGSSANYLLFFNAADVSCGDVSDKEHLNEVALNKSALDKVALDIALRREGIAIRNCSNYHGLGDGWYRIAVRRHEENEKFLDAVRRMLAE